MDHYSGVLIGTIAREYRLQCQTRVVGRLKLGRLRLERLKFIDKTGLLSMIKVAVADMLNRSFA